jgi:hypothetical protein
MREVFSRVRALGKARGLDPGFVEGLWKAIVDEAMRIESEALAGAPARRPDRGPPKAKDKKELSCRRP